MASVRTVTLPDAPARAVTVNVTVAPLASAGSVQVAVLGSMAQCGVHDAAVRFAGSKMLAVMPAALAGPALARASRQVASSPVMMAAAQAREAEISALSGAGL